MSANLEIDENGVAKMFYVASDGTPWHRDGIPVDEAKTSAEAIRIAGMDWETELENIYDSRGREIPRKLAVVRSTDRRVLGIVGTNYKPIQNVECFDFLDSLYADGILRYSSAGLINDGSVAWMQATLGADMRVLDDVYRRFLHASTSHDGSRGLSVHHGNTRIVCENTLIEASRSAALARITHAGDVEAKMAAARELVKVTNEQSKRMEAWLTGLTKIDVTESTFSDFRDAFLGPLDEATATQRRKAIEAFTEIYEAEAAYVGNTAYALANAVTGYADHFIKVKAGQSKLESTIDGRTSIIKNLGLNMVKKLAAV